jgi:hypothetical protein
VPQHGYLDILMVNPPVVMSSPMRALRSAIWHVAEPPATPGELAPELASRLLDAYTQPADLVIDVDEDVAFAAAATVTGRHHAALGGDTRLVALSRRAGTADLVVMRWPRHRPTPARSWLPADPCYAPTDGWPSPSPMTPTNAPHTSAP